MNTIVKFKDAIIFKLSIIPLILCCCINTLQAQELSASKSVAESHADKDWEELKYSMGDLGLAVEYQAALKEGVLGWQRYEDKYKKSSSHLAEEFWSNYPQDSRHYDALFLFFSPTAEPRFISNIASDSLIQLLANIPRIPRHEKRRNRILPVDNVAREQWRQTGDNMVASVLNSNASLERKESAEFQLISREFRYTMMLDNLLTKENSESDYWNRFEIQYWKHIRLLLENHVNKYATLEVGADRVQNILNLLKNFSKSASDTFWHYFFETTGSDNPLSNKPGIKALHKMATENVVAIEALKEVDYTKPLEMVFIDMDGRSVDLSNMRDKLVLIDFWATYCGPCIKEMPHVQAMYDKYRNQGFEVIGIATDSDENKGRVLDILNKTGANWPQRLDKGSNATVSFHALYKITRLPTVWLLNKEGVIVDRNARGQRLESLIRKHLGLE